MNSKSSHSNKVNIIVVDDIADNLRLLSAILTQQGYLVRKALNGKLALIACETQLPDLMLLDITMPGMDGYEVCQKLKANEKTREIPIIFISALGDVEDKVKAFAVGGVDYISKPFQSEEVVSRVENQLKLRSLQRALQEKNLSLEIEIEKREKIQKDLEASEAKNMALLNAIPDVMLRISADNILLDYRAAQSNLQGEISQPIATYNNSNFPEFDQNFIGNKLTDVLSSDLALWVSYYVDRALSESTIQIGEYVQQINGIWHAYEARYVPSNKQEVLAIFRNISERKKLEAERLQSQALLNIQKQQIEKNLYDIQQAQAQLIQNEKMTSLGQLVAGIAHEINNPINFIYGNISHANAYIQEVVNLLKLYQQEYQPNNKIKKFLEDHDLEFAINDLQKLFESMKTGANRIRQIVLSLRNFARLDEAATKSVNIEEGINNTLVLLEHRIKAVDDRPAIQIIKEYHKLPKIICYASLINQVFFYLLTNAIDALDSQFNLLDKTSGEKNIDYSEKNPNPTILIRTELGEKDRVIIRIKDNGPGIEESLRSRLFDPFFTTKPVGMGTGLGLSISYQIIVQQHKGNLTCNSSPGKGAEFIIEIPINSENLI